ncbi:MAG: formyl transferase [Deltaproteobacteria bacterium]|nr:formyl transferase [Deltaproteobacteria bacterium]
MRSVVFAYHDIGYVCLRELLDAGASVAAVITHDDDPGEAIWFRSVRQLAEAHGLPVFAPDTVNTSEWVARIAGWKPDFLFSFYFRKLLSNDILALPARGALNLHGSLLPKYRGRCPVNWVLIHDERETGVTLHYMVEKPDRGDIVAQRAVPITDADTALTLFHKLTEAAAALMRETYPLLCAGRAPRRPQDQTQASYFGGRKPEDGRIAWVQSARTIFNLVRAVTHPYPGAFTTWQGRRLYVWEAEPVAGTSGAPVGTVLSTTPALIVQTGAGSVHLRRLQLDGGSEMLGSDWARLYEIQEGAQFG